MSRPVRATMAALLVASVLTACNLTPDAPVVAPVGPTAPATALPQAPSTAAADMQAAYDDAEARIEEMLRETSRQPIDTVRGVVPGTEEEFDVQILSLQTNDLSLVLHLQVVPVGGAPLDLSAVDGGLSGGLGDGNRTIADIALVGEGSELELLPTVYRPDVGTEDSAQRCMCSSLPAMVPPEGVRMTAHYVRPDEPFLSVRVQVPSAEPSVVIGID